MDSNISNHIAQLRQKIQQLIKLQDGLQKENARLKKELAKAAEKQQQAQEQLLHLQQQLDAARINTGDQSPDEKKQLSKRIDMYLKEIDKCLAIINKA